MNRFNFGSEIPNRAAILAGGRRASQHSCKSSSSAVAGVHCLKARGIASIQGLEGRRQPCAGVCHANKGTSLPQTVQPGTGALINALSNSASRTAA
jgi:hypothetical protein